MIFFMRSTLEAACFACKLSMSLTLLTVFFPGQLMYGEHLWQFTGAVGVLTAGAVGLGVALELSVRASGIELHPPKYPWNHKGMLDSFDHASMRRGYQVGLFYECLKTSACLELWKSGLMLDIMTVTCVLPFSCYCCIIIWNVRLWLVKCASRAVSKKLMMAG